MNEACDFCGDTHWELCDVMDCKDRELALLRKVAEAAENEHASCKAKTSGDGYANNCCGCTCGEGVHAALAAWKAGKK